MKLYLSVGDPAGIGPELALKFIKRLTQRNYVFFLNKLFNRATNNFPKSFLSVKKLFDKGKVEFHVVGNYFAMLHAAQCLDKNVRNFIFNFFSYEEMLNNLLKRAYKNFFFYNIKLSKALLSKQLRNKKIPAGKIAGEIAFKTLQQCCKLIDADKISNSNNKNALVTLPIDKNSISKYLKTPFFGHTNFLSKKYTKHENSVSMAFSTPVFQMVLITVHIPLKKVSTLLTQKKKGKKIINAAITNGLYLQKCYNDTNPLYVLGVNPHAGEGGLLGTEEKEIERILAVHRKAGHAIVGPLPADGFMRLILAKHNKKKKLITKPTIVSPYHDQGLVAAKMAATNYNGVNISLGLPFVRTSVDHGTAYDIVGKNAGNCNSLFLAVQEAVRLCTIPAK